MTDLSKSTELSDAQAAFALAPWKAKFEKAIEEYSARTRNELRQLVFMAFEAGYQAGKPETMEAVKDE